MILQEPVAINFADISNYNVTQEIALWDAAYNGGAGYSVGDKVRIDDMGLKVYESATDTNTTEPGLSPDWFQVSTSNWAAMFDDLSSTQTINNDLIEVTLSSSSIVTGLSFINIEADSLQVVVNDPTAGEIYNQTFDLVQHETYNYRDWFLETPTNITRFDVDDIEPTVNGTTTIRFTRTGGQVKVGQISRGYRRVIGKCEWGGIQPEIFTYSQINEDTFGNIDIIQRLKKRDVSFQVQIETSQLDRVIDLVEQYQDKPALFIGSGDYQGSFVYGLVERFSPSYDNLINSPYTLRIKGYA